MKPVSSRLEQPTRTAKRLQVLLIERTETVLKMRGPLTDAHSGSGGWMES